MLDSDSSDTGPIEPTCTFESIKRIFAGSPVSEEEFSVTLMSVFQRHRLTYACQSDLLQLLSMFLPSPNGVPPSVHVLNKQYLDLNKDTITHRCCGKCMELLPITTKCTKPECITAKLPDVLLLEIPLQMQLMDRFKGTSACQHCV